MLCSVAWSLRGNRPQKGCKRHTNMAIEVSSIRISPVCPWDSETLIHNALLSAWSVIIVWNVKMHDLMPYKLQSQLESSGHTALCSIDLFHVLGLFLEKDQLIAGAQGSFTSSSRSPCANRYDSLLTERQNSLSPDSFQSGSHKLSRSRRRIWSQHSESLQKPCPALSASSSVKKGIERSTRYLSRDDIRRGAFAVWKSCHFWLLTISAKQNIPACVAAHIMRLGLWKELCT